MRSGMLASAALVAAVFTTTAHSDSGLLPEGMTEASIVAAVGEPILRQVKEQDSPSCALTRYVFGDEIVGLKLEFRCTRVNVAWMATTEAGYEEKSAKAQAMATRAVVAISGGVGIEVEKAIAGEVFSGKGFDNGMTLKGSCLSESCLLSFY